MRMWLNEKLFAIWDKTVNRFSSEVYKYGTMWGSDILSGDSTKPIENEPKGMFVIVETKRPYRLGMKLNSQRSDVAHFTSEVLDKS